MAQLAFLSDYQLIFLGMTAAYILAVVFVGLYHSGKQTDDSFIIGSRNVGTVATIGALAASFRDGMGAVFWTGMAYNFGYGGLWLIYGAMAALCFLGIVGPMVRKQADKGGYVTIGDYLHDKLGRYSERVVSIFVLTRSFLMVAIQLFVIGLVVSKVFAVPDAYGIIGTAFVILAYLYFGGYASVVRTDVFQFFMILSLVMVPFFIRPDMAGVLDFSTVVSKGWQESAGLFILGIFYIIAGADAWQRVFSARNGAVIRRAFPLAGVFLLLMTINMIIIGYGLIPVLPEGTPADKALFSLFENYQLFSPYLIAYIGVVIMAISMSTLSSEAYVFTSSLVRNFFPEEYSRVKKKYVSVSRVVILCILAGTSYVAIGITDVITFLIDAVSFVFVISPLVVFAVMGWLRRSEIQDKLLALSVAVSASLFLYMFFNGLFLTTLHNMLPLGVSTLLCTAAVLATRGATPSQKQVTAVKAVAAPKKATKKKTAKKGAKKAPAAKAVAPKAASKPAKKKAAPKKKAKK